MKVVVANSNPTHAPVVRQCVKSFKAITVKTKEQLSVQKLKRIKPDYIFFLHWSHIIPKEIYENFNCVLFHMTDLPYGRGGSPLQNLIVRGHSETKISAIKVVREIDAGPVFAKRKISLNGTAEEIFLRAGKVMFNMMKDIIAKNPKPIGQKGKIVTFRRRTPAESNMAAISDTRTIFDFIRMLDADGYPKAFIETECFKFEFSKAVLRSDCINAQVKIIKKS